MKKVFAIILALALSMVACGAEKSKILGIAFGAMSYTIIDKIIASLGLDALINDTIKGSILLVAVMVQIVVPMIRNEIRKAAKAKAKAKELA